MSFLHPDVGAAAAQQPSAATGDGSAQAILFRTAAVDEASSTGLWSPHPKGVYAAATAIRKWLGIEHNPPIAECINRGFVPRLVELVRSVDLASHNSKCIAFEAAWALTNVASGNSEHAFHVVRAGAVPVFVALLSCGDPQLSEQCSWALGNIAGDSAALRDVCLESGALGGLLSFLSRQPDTSGLRNGVWALNNLTRHSPPPPLASVAPALPLLRTLVLDSEDEEVLAGACWALSYIAGASTSGAVAVGSTGVCPRLVELLGRPHPALLAATLRVLGAVAASPAIREVVQAGGVAAMLNILEVESRRSTRRMAARALARVAAAGPAHVDVLIEHDVVSRLPHDTRYVEEAEAYARVLFSMCQGAGPTQVVKLFQDGFFGWALCQRLSHHNGTVTRLAAEGLALLAECGEAASRSSMQPNPVARCLALHVGRTAETLAALMRTGTPEVRQAAARLLEVVVDG